jgi:hypothetical protein
MEEEKLKPFSGGWILCRNTRLLAGAAQMKFVCLSFLLILAGSQEQFCSVKLCGMKTGCLFSILDSLPHNFLDFVQEIEKSYLFLGNSTLSAEDEEVNPKGLDYFTQL